MTGPAIPAGLTAALNTALSLTQTGTNDGSIAWDFSVANSLTQYLADAQAIGPFLQGFAQPISDLSRGGTVEDIVNTTAVTLAQI